MHGRPAALFAPVLAASLFLSTESVRADRPTPETILGKPPASVSGDFPPSNYFRRFAEEAPVVEAAESRARDVALPPEPRVALRDRELEPPGSTDSYSTALHSELTAPAARAVRVRREHRRAILSFYRDRGFAPAWTGDYGLSERGKRILRVLAKADGEGLRPIDYLPATMAAYGGYSVLADATPSTLARLDLELTAAALDYVQDMTAGTVDPFRISEIHTLDVNEVPPAEALRQLTATVRPQVYLASLAPAMPQYGLLRAALAGLRRHARNAAAVRIPAGPAIRPGAADDRTGLVRARLRQLGLYEAPAGPGPASANVYDEALAEAVKAFQRGAGLGVDGIIGRRTVTAMNGQSVTRKIEKIRLSMERLRWLPRDLKSKYVFVNQAFFKTWLIDSGKVIFRSDVIVGKPRFQTAVFMDEMETVVFNPYWWVPRSIAKAEYLPYLKVDPSYLDRIGYEVVTRSREVRSSSSIDWYGLDAETMPYDIRQPPGPKNALGRVKFLFPNKHAIYMHDTPARNLFSHEVRAFSHGCVRVARPLEFANAIMQSEGWSRSRVADAIDSGERQEIMLKTRIPVYLGYYTAWVNDDGRVEFRDDIYDRDRVLLQAMEQNDSQNARRRPALRQM